MAVNEQIIIDTDPGVDDMLALLYAFSANLPITAISTVYGNSSLYNVTRNAGYIVKHLDSNWEIYKGASKPLTGEARRAKSHGVYGLGKVTPQDAEITQPSHESSTALLSTLNHKTTNTIFCLGPLTNIAIALRNTKIARNIDRLIIMGGAFTEAGNTTNYAEFNCINDPEAFQAVIDAATKYKIDTVVVPVEICRKVLLTRYDLQQLERRSKFPSFRKIVEPFLDYYISNRGYDGAVLYDVLVPLYYQHSKLFTVVPSRVCVELSDKERRGQTTATEDASSSIKICTDILASQAKNIVMETLAKQ